MYHHQCAHPWWGASHWPSCVVRSARLPVMDTGNLVCTASLSNRSHACTRCNPKSQRELRSEDCVVGKNLKAQQGDNFKQKCLCWPIQIGRWYSLATNWQTPAVRFHYMWELRNSKTGYTSIVRIDKFRETWRENVSTQTTVPHNCTSTELHTQTQRNSDGNSPSHKACGWE